MNYWLDTWVLNGLNDGSIDHLEYAIGGGIATVVWANGSTCLIDIVPTRDRRKREHDEMVRRIIDAGGMVFPVKMRVKIPAEFHGFIYNAGC